MRKCGRLGKHEKETNYIPILSSLALFCERETSMLTGVWEAGPMSHVDTLRNWLRRDLKEHVTYPSILCEKNLKLVSSSSLSMIKTKINFIFLNL